MHKYYPALFLISFNLLTCDLFAQNWPRFRGENAQGAVKENYPAKWTDKDYAWTVQLPGEGTASPVTWGDKVFVTAAAPASRGQVEAGKAKGGRKLACYDIKTGNLLWDQSFDIDASKMHKDSTYANGTPTVDKDHVYVLWQDPKETALHAFTHDGEKAWTAKLGPFKAPLGTAGSPIAHDGKVIVIHDQASENTFRAAIDAKSGGILWKEPHTGEKVRDCYATPIIYTAKDGKSIGISVHSYRGFAGFDLTTGKKIWELRNCFGDHAQRAISSPIISGDLVIAGSGFAKGKRNLVAVKAMTGKEVWRQQIKVPYMPTPLAKGELLFLWEDSGIVKCLTAATGKILWEKRLRGTYYSSPVLAGDKIYGIDRYGNVNVIAAKDTFEQLGKANLGEDILSTPAFGHGHMLFRTADKLLALQALNQ